MAVMCRSANHAGSPNLPSTAPASCGLSTARCRSWGSGWQISRAGAAPITAAGLHEGPEPNNYVGEFSSGEVFEPRQRSWKKRANWLRSWSRSAQTQIA